MNLYNKKVVMKISYLDKFFYVTNVQDKFHLIVYENKIFTPTDIELLNFVVDYICKLLKE